MNHQKYGNGWNKLTKDEKQYMLTHPWHIDDIQGNTFKAIKKAVNLFGSGSLHNGAGDAFRHCYWSALLARDIGEDNAKTFTIAHESRASNPKNEKDMDLHNNQKGIEIGRINSNASDGELAMKCLNALFIGELKVLKP